MSRERILCKWHNDTEPSMVVYGLWAHCHVCLAHVKTSELDLPENKVRYEKKEPTNIPARIEQIKALPTKLIRGFELPYDESGYYLIWTNENYYKRRNWHGKNRYTSPVATAKPLFVCPGKELIAPKKVVIVEGELNALSLHKHVTDRTIVSPGAASELIKYIKDYLNFEDIVIVVDYDAPGVVYGDMLRNILHKHGKCATLRATKIDFNELYEKGGEDAVRRSWNELMGNAAHGLK